jgi:hypothetical protein
MHRLSLYEDCIPLNIPVEHNLIDTNTLNWKQYNPRKSINRFGCSITSLDGNDSGIPDLDSVLEYNLLNNTVYTEKDFNVQTKHSVPFVEFLNTFQVGRSHYIKLEPGGFFPWHRDDDPNTFRIMYTISNCTPDSLVWLEDDKILPLTDRTWFYINTRKKHSLFSFGTAVFAVFNVLTNTHNINLLKSSFRIR